MWGRRLGKFDGKLMAKKVVEIYKWENRKNAMAQ
jgi:hypothetical protein